MYRRVLNLSSGVERHGDAHLGLLLVVALAWTACAPGERAAIPQRVVLVTLDTLRAESLDAERMPVLHGLAQRGLMFERAYAASNVTQPSHASLFTALHPWEHGVVRNGAVLEDEHETIAEALSVQGFDRAAVVASFPLDARFSFDQGFARYETVFERPLGGIRAWAGAKMDGESFYGLAGPVTEAALRALDAFEGSKQFLWVHYFDAHDPYGEHAGTPLPIGRLRAAARARDPALGAMLSRAQTLYGADVAALDRALGPLFGRLDADSDRFETHLIVTADHGESLGGDGSIGHGSRLTADQIQIPLLIVSPRVAPGRRRDVAGSIDLPATIFALAGLPTWAGPGRDLSSSPPGGGGHAYGMSNLAGGKEVRTDGRAVSTATPRFYAVHGEALYAGDARTMHLGDLDEPVPEGEARAEVADLFMTFAQAAARAETREHLDEKTLRALKSLGYVR